VRGGQRGQRASGLSALPLPPTCVAGNGVFPTFPEMLEHMKQVGGVFSYEIIGGRRIAIVADPELYEEVFSPDEMGATPGVGDAVKVEMDKLAHAWFGIPFPIVTHTKPSLAAVRAAIGPQKVGALVNKVGDGVKQLFDSMPAHGTVDLVKVAHGTFWPVNAAMFGEATISESRCPGADSWFHAFDEYIPQVTGGMPATMFDEMQEAAAKVVDMFQRSIEAGNHLDAQQCPVLHDRFLPIPHDKLAAYSSKEKAQFMLSLFWAPQANTLPMTWWTLAHILADSRVKSLVEREARGSAFASAPRNGVWPYDEHALPYINACMKEVLRMYIANLTQRSVARDIPLEESGSRYPRRTCSPSRLTPGTTTRTCTRIRMC
jgi:cytochrome P450